MANTIDILGDNAVMDSLINKTITEFVDDTITRIGDGAFGVCRELTSIDVPKVTSIGERAFYGCHALTSIDTSKVTSIGNEAFNSCRVLTSVDMSNVTSVGDGAFNSCHALTSVDVPNVTSIEGNTFYGCSALTSIDAPNATRIGERAFMNCISLISIDMPKVTTINDSDFMNCTSLTSVNMPNAIRIEGNAFYSCSALTSVDMPNVTTIGKYAFMNCTSLTSVNMPKVTSISNNAFCACNNLTSADFPNATSIGDNAFDGCNNLTSIDFPNATSIGKRTFAACNNLTSADFPNATSIGDNAFAACNNLTSADFPNATSIGDNAFDGCNNLTSIDLSNSESVCELGSNAFLNTGIDGVNGFIYVPFELFNNYKTHPTWAQYNDVIAPVGNGVYIEGVEDIYLLYNTSKLTSVRYFYNLENQDNLEPTITVTSTNENIATVTNVLLDNNHISFNVNSLSATGDTDIVIAATIGEYTHSTTFKIRVSETAPIVTYEVESVENSVYGFEMNNSGYYESKNKGVKSSYAICKLLLYTEGANNIYLDCISYGEDKYDYGIISNINTTLTLSYNADSNNVLKSFKGLSSSNIQTVDLGVLPQGEYFVYIKYIKDSSGDNNYDTLQFKVRTESIFE